jgi:hypothetical protein
MTQTENETMELETSRGVKYLIDAQDLHLVESYNWHLDTSGYIYRHRWSNGKDKPVRLHRIIINADKDIDVDHINGIRTDNRRCNLRACTRQQNIFNSSKRCTNTTGYKGVYLDKRNKRFRARIKINGLEIPLGYFETALEASEAYNKAASEYHKEFAKV